MINYHLRKVKKQPPCTTDCDHLGEFNQCVLIKVTFFLKTISKKLQISSCVEVMTCSRPFQGPVEELLPFHKPPSIIVVVFAPLPWVTTQRFPFSPCNGPRHSLSGTWPIASVHFDLSCCGGGIPRCPMGAGDGSQTS